MAYYIKYPPPPPPPPSPQKRVIASDWERGSLLYIIYIPERVVKWP